MKVWWWNVVRGKKTNSFTSRSTSYKKHTAKSANNIPLFTPHISAVVWWNPEAKSGGFCSWGSSSWDLAHDVEHVWHLATCGHYMQWFLRQRRCDSFKLTIDKFSPKNTRIHSPDLQSEGGKKQTAKPLHPMVVLVFTEKKNLAELRMLWTLHLIIKLHQKNRMDRPAFKHTKLGGRPFCSCKASCHVADHPAPHAANMSFAGK